jgi:O-antigen ligase
MYEGPRQVYSAFVNHAHNDYAEVFLEGGLFAVALFVAFLLWFAVAALRAWLPAGSRSLSALDRGLPKAAAIAILLLLLHSGVDYPLRTTALASLFAFLCALLIAPSRGGELENEPHLSPRHQDRRFPARKPSRKPSKRSA